MKRIFLSVAFAFGIMMSFAQDAAEMINSANEALKAKDYTKAFELYDNAMKNLGDVQIDASINFNIGFAALQADKFDAALSYFDKAIAAGTNVAGCYEYKGNAYAKLDKFTEAIASYKKAIESGAQDKGDIYYNAAIVAFKGKIYDQAAELFGNAYAANVNPENALFYKAASLKKLDKDDEYKQTLVLGVEKFPGNDKIKSALASIYVAEGNAIYKKGATILKAANDKVTAGTIKTSDPAYTQEVDKSKVEFSAALEVLEKAKALDPNNANAVKLVDACTAALK